VEVDAINLPTVHTEDVTSLISDSGVTRYRFITKVWDIYATPDTSYWHFPEGVYIEKFDSLFNTIGSVKADMAYFFENKGLWQLKGHVDIENLQGVKLQTSELFWNQNEPADSYNSIYTDSFARVDNGPDRVFTGYGLRSTQDLSHYVFYKSGMEAEINERTDSTAQSPATL
jgi:hypothetical protein